MKVHKLTQKEFVVWGLIYLLYIEHGTNILNFASMSVVLPLTILVCFLSFNYHCLLSKKMVFIFGILLMNHLITGILSGASISEGFNFAGWLEMVFVVMAVRLIYKLDDDAMTKFLSMVYLFACISLICYTLVIGGLGNILIRLFSIYRTGMGNVAGKFLYVYNLNHPERNSGIFTEPGIYQLVLIMCIYVLLFMRDRISLTDKAVARYLIVLLITLITTKSAAGYVGLFAVIIGTLLKRKERKDIIIVGIMIAAFTYLIYNYYTQGSNSILEKYFFGKFVETQKRSLTLSSGGARLVAMQMGWKAAISHPFGIGYLNWENQLFELYGTKFGTGNALFTQLGTRGFIAFFISLYLAIEPAWKRRKSWLEFMIYIFLFLYITIVQAKILYPAIVLAAYLPRKDWQTRK